MGLKVQSMVKWVERYSQARLVCWLQHTESHPSFLILIESSVYLCCTGGSAHPTRKAPLAASLEQPHARWMILTALHILDKLT